MIRSFTAATRRQLFRWTLALTAATAAVAAPLAHAADADHPLLSRVAGFEIERKTVKQFDVVQPSPVGEWPKGQATSFEGKVTVVEYSAENPSSEIKIYRNYLAAVTQAGGKQLNVRFDANAPVAHNTGAHVFALPTKPGPTIALLEITSGWRYRLSFIEPEAMEQSVTAAELGKEIQSKGFATLHIGFDTNKAELKADGVAAVKEIAALLKQDRTLKLSIDGHTDNVGQAAANKALSLARAAAVVKAVVAEGVDASRLKAQGFGQVVPVADNRTEEGRAKNRRVELVKIGAAKP